MPEVLTVKDIQDILNIGRNQAYEVIKKVKSKSDKLGLQGKIHRSDYNLYFYGQEIGITGSDKEC